MGKGHHDVGARVDGDYIERGALFGGLGSAVANPLSIAYSPLSAKAPAGAPAREAAGLGGLFGGAVGGFSLNLGLGGGGGGEEEEEEKGEAPIDISPSLLYPLTSNMGSFCSKRGEKVCCGPLCSRYPLCGRHKLWGLDSKGERQLTILKEGWRVSDFAEMGPGVTSYFKFVKYLA